MLDVEGRPRAPRLLRTSEVLRRAGISRQVLYRYITLGLIQEAQVTASGQRLFHPRVVRWIELIRSLNDTGYALRDIRDTFFRDKRVGRLGRSM